MEVIEDALEALVAISREEDAAPLTRNQALILVETFRLILDEAFPEEKELEKKFEHPPVRPEGYTPEQLKAYENEHNNSEM